MKIIKNKKAYKNQAIIELKILEFLNNEVDKQDLHHIIRLYDHFVFKEHLCIIFELLNENLYELLKQNYFQGISFNSIRFIMKQILEAVYQLQKANLIHCDLKPENILLKIDKDSTKNDIIIKITDFGSACFKNYTMYQYIQSRYYRAPEVLLGCGYSHEIDMWSIGCIAAELYLGEPVLPGSCEYDQLNKIIHLIGDIPDRMIKEGRNSKKYFTFDTKYKMVRIKSVEEYYKEFSNDIEPKYDIPLGLNSLDELLLKTNNKKNLSSSHSNCDVIYELECFVNFLKGLLTIDPKFRWNAKQALRHPFITKERFDGNYNPNYEDVSHLHFNSVEGSYLSDFQNGGYYNMRGNPNLCHSMMINFNPYVSGNFSQTLSNISLNNSSQDMSCYQYNMRKIPMQLLKNFPFAKIDELNLKPTNSNENKWKNNLKEKNLNKYNKTHNKTFMMTSYDELHSNNSFASELNFYNQKRRKLQDNTSKGNKYSKLQMMHGKESHNSINKGTHNIFNTQNPMNSSNGMPHWNNLSVLRGDSKHSTGSSKLFLIKIP
jgi:serine/threonine protein kinase